VTSTWRVEHDRGAASVFHSRPVPDPAERAVWVLTVDRPALVLGSAQPLEDVDAEACARLGVEIVRRRSGGGGVLLVPGDVLWVDVVVPRGDPLWCDDVGQAFHWLGDAWVAALGACGVTGMSVHRGPMRHSPWSSLVCFAGVGAGEVVQAGRKVVGLSQRRTRPGARFQCAVYHRWDPAALVAVLRDPPPLAELEGLALPVPAPPEQVAAAFVAAVTTG
jgi:lipoate---protein ligase